MSITENFSRKLKGDSRFVTDILPDNPLFGLTIRAAIPRGEILSIILPELPEGYLAADYKTIPGKNHITLFGQQFPVLAENRVHYFGEPVLLLAGPSLQRLKQLAAEVKIEYREETPVLGLDELKSNSLQDNVCFVKGDVKEAFLSAAFNLQAEYNTSVQIPYNIEPESTIAIYNTFQIIVYAASHYPYNIRDNLADVLNVPKKKIRVIIPDMCSVFGGKLVIPPLIAAHACLLANLTRKAVKIQYSQTEDLCYGVRKHPFRIRCTSALDKSGAITALDVEAQVDMGSHAVLSDYIAGKMITAFTQYYRCANLRLNIVFNKTNKPPMGGFTGIGEEIVSFVMEQHSEEIAAATGQAPIAWKTANLIPVKSKKTPPAPGAALEKVAALSDFRRKYGAYAALAAGEKDVFESGRPIRGIGLALCPHHITVGYENIRPGYKIEAVFGKDMKLRIRTSAIDIGDSKASLFAMTASNLLNIHISEVILEQVDTLKVPDSGATTSSKAVSILNKLVEQSCLSIKRKMRKSPLPLSVQKRYRAHPGHDIVATTWEATVVEVEIDPITFEIGCRGIWIVVDAGEVINPEIARNHLEAAAMLNYENACTEIKDTEHLVNHLVAGSIDIPPIEIHFLQREKNNQGPRSLGDQPVCGVAPAYINAVSQACALPFRQLPVTPEILQKFRLNHAD